MTGLDELKKFIRPSYFYLYTSAVFLFIGLFFGIATKQIVMLLIFGGIAVLNSITTISAIRGYNDLFRRYTDDGSIDRIVKEFQSAQPFAEGRLRMGPYHIFGQKSGTILEYRDIAKVYQYIRKTNFAEDRRELRVVTAGGKTVTLCRLLTGGKSDKTVTEALAVMLAQNPGIRIGYR